MCVKIRSGSVSLIRSGSVSCVKIRSGSVSIIRSGSVSVCVKIRS